MKQPSFFLFALIAVLSAAFLYSCDEDCSDGFRDNTFDETAWTRSLQSNVPMGEIRLNNYTSSPGRFCGHVPDPANPLCNTPQNMNSSLFCQGAELQFKHPCNSSISFPVIGTQYFDIEVPSIGPDNMLRIYINDVNSSRLSVDARDDRLVIGIDFEGVGEDEIMGNCYNNLFCFVGAPAFNLDDIHIDLAFILSAEGGRITYSDVEVTVNADFMNSGMCSNSAFAFLCGDSRSQVFENLRNQFHLALMQPEIRSYMNQALHSAIATDLGLGVRMIRNAGVLENQLVLSLECE